MGREGGRVWKEGGEEHLHATHRLWHFVGADDHTQSVHLAEATSHIRPECNAARASRLGPAEPVSSLHTSPPVSSRHNPTTPPAVPLHKTSTQATLPHHPTHSPLHPLATPPTCHSIHSILHLLTTPPFNTPPVHFSPFHHCTSPSFHLHTTPLPLHYSPPSTPAVHHISKANCQLMQGGLGTACGSAQTQSKKRVSSGSSIETGTGRMRATCRGKGDGE